LPLADDETVIVRSQSVHALLISSSHRADAGTNVINAPTDDDKDEQD
jgi:hypothetical protein